MKKSWTLFSRTPLSVAQFLAAETVIDAKNYSIFVVRRSGGGGGEFLRLRVQEFKGQRDDSLHRGGAFGAEGLGDDGVIRAGWTGVRGLERRAAIQVHRSGLVRGQLRDAGRDRLLLGEALVRRRGGGAMRLGHG